MRLEGREKILAELRYKPGRQADPGAVFRAWKNATRIDVRAEGIVEIRGKRYHKHSLVIYEEASP